MTRNYVYESESMTGCHRLNCNYSLGGVMGSVLMCIFSVDKYI